MTGRHTAATISIFSPGANIPSPADLTSISDKAVFQSGGVGFWVASHAMIAARAPRSFTPGKTMFVPGANSDGDAKKASSFSASH